MEIIFVIWLIHEYVGSGIDALTAHLVAMDRRYEYERNMLGILASLEFAAQFYAGAVFEKQIGYDKVRKTLPY